jgi:protein CWC15
VNTCSLIQGKTSDLWYSDEDEDSDEEDDDEDETAELMRELEKIKRERAEEQARKVS